MKIVAEAWDAAGAYEVGSFSERRWAEWNCRYRDDIRHFWRGDNNAWCQDNETSWYDRDSLEWHSEIFRFTRGMIAFRRDHPVLSREQFYTDADIHWYDPQGGLPDWENQEENRLACLIREDEQRSLYLMFNAGTDWATFALPTAPAGFRWHLAVDTALDAQQDLSAAGDELLCADQHTYRLGSRSSAILLIRRTNFQELRKDGRRANEQ